RGLSQVGRLCSLRQAQGRDRGSPAGGRTRCVEATGFVTTPKAGALSAGGALARRHSRSPGVPCSGFGDRFTDEVERTADQDDAVAPNPFPRATERFGRGFRGFRFTRELLCEVGRRRSAVPANP